MVLAQCWSRFHGVLGIGALVAAGFLGTAANAQTQQQVEWCNNNGRAFAPDLAISGCTAAIQSHKEPQYRASAYVNRGAAWEDKFDHDRAIADYSEAIRLSPFPRAFSSRGIVYFNRKDYDRAIADFTEAIRLDPNIASAFDDRAGAYQAKGDLDRAIADFTEVIRLIPNIAYVFNNRADAYKAKGDLDHAIADYSEAISLDPTNKFTYINRGNAWYRKGDLDRAIADFTEAIRLQPIARAYYGRGIAWHDKGDFNRATADYDQAIRLDPNDALGLGIQSAKSYAEKRSAAPRAGARTAQSGADQTALVNKAMAAFEAKNWNEAEAAWKELVRLDPSRWDYQQALGATQLNLGHYDDAVASFGSGIRLVEKSATGNSPEAAKAKSALSMMLTNQGNAFLKQKKNDNAIAAFEKAIIYLTTEAA